MCDSSLIEKYIPMEVCACVFIVAIIVRLKLHLFLLFFSIGYVVYINGEESLNYLQSTIEYVDGDI